MSMGAGIELAEWFANFEAERVYAMFAETLRGTGSTETARLDSQ